MHFQVKAILSIQDAWLDLQDGFDHRPTSAFFPLTIAPSSRAGMLFKIRVGETTTKGEATQLNAESLLNISYRISGDRHSGAHAPVPLDPDIAQGITPDLIFKSAIVLQRPGLDPCLAVGFLPLPSDLKVGQLVTVAWRIERLKDFEKNSVPESDEVLYEVNANSENWMIAGRKRGHVSLSEKQGSRIAVSILCVPLVAGYVRPPNLELPNVGETDILCNPTAPHLVCIMPPVLSSSYCIPAS